jgi:hypothetical protein
MLSFACNQVYSVETLAAQHTSANSINHQISEVEQLDLPLHHYAESHEVEIAASPLEPTDNMMSQGDSDPTAEGLTQEVTAINNPNTRTDETAPFQPHRTRQTAKQKPESVLDLELKLFKNMAIGIVSQATPLRPMLPRDREVDDEPLSATLNASEASPEERSVRLPPDLHRYGYGKKPQRIFCIPGPPGYGYP